MSTKETRESSDSNIAEKYLIAENATRPFANDMIKSIGLDSLNGDAHVFDFACGTGAVVKELYKLTRKEKWDTLKVLGGDISTSMLESLKESGKKEGWTGLSTKIVDANNMQLEPNQFTHLFIAFGIFVMPDGTLEKCLELLKPGGHISISSWAYLPWYPYVVRAVELLPEHDRPTMPSEAEVESAIYMKRPFNDPAYISTILKEAGFTDVNVVSRENPAEGGTPEKMVDVMYMPLKIISGLWAKNQGLQGGEEQERLIKAVQGKFLELIEEEFGKGGVTKMTFKAIMGSGRKAK